MFLMFMSCAKASVGEESSRRPQMSGLDLNARRSCFRCKHSASVWGVVRVPRRSWRRSHADLENARWPGCGAGIGSPDMKCLMARMALWFPQRASDD